MEVFIEAFFGANHLFDDPEDSLLILELPAPGHLQIVEKQVLLHGTGLALTAVKVAACKHVKHVSYCFLTVFTVFLNVFSFHHSCTSKFFVSENKKDLHIIGQTSSPFQIFADP